jgi:hypothetical protein
VAITYIGASEQSGAFALEPIGLNPGAGPFTIRFTVPARATVDLQVFDMMGRRVAQLASGEWRREDTRRRGRGVTPADSAGRASMWSATASRAVEPHAAWF